MFTVTAKGVYGLSALIELGFSYGQGARQIKDVAAAHDIPQHYLEQILLVLRKAGIVESFRGSRGGYALARKPAHINVLNALSLLEGKLEVIPEQRKDNSLCFFWYKLENVIHDFLDCSLETLMDEIQKQQKNIMYSI